MTYQANGHRPEKVCVVGLIMARQLLKAGIPFDLHATSTSPGARVKARSIPIIQPTLGTDIA